MSVAFIWKETAEKETNAHFTIQQTASSVTNAQMQNVRADIQIKEPAIRNQVIKTNLDKENLALDHQEKRYQPAPQGQEEGSKRKQPQDHQDKAHPMTKRKRKVREKDQTLQAEERKTRVERNHPEDRPIWQ